MKKNIFAALIIIIAVVLQSCAGTNKLGKYNLSGENVLFDTYGGDAKFRAEFDNDDIDTDSKTVNVVLNIAKSVATQYVTNAVQEKLYNAAAPEKVGNAISDELKRTMVKYISIAPVANAEQDYNYIVTTYIEDVILKSNGNGMFLSVNARTEMRKRQTAELIWEDKEYETVPLRSYLDGVDKDNYGDNVSDVMLLSELATMSEERLTNAVMLASKRIGREIAEEFIEDLSDARR